MTFIQALCGRTTISSSSPSSSFLASHELVMINQATSQVSHAQLFGVFQSIFGGSLSSRDAFGGWGAPAPSCAGVSPPPGECLASSSSAFTLERLAAAWCPPATMACDPTPTCEDPAVCAGPVLREEPPYSSPSEGGNGDVAPAADPCGDRSRDRCGTEQDGLDCDSDNDGPDCDSDSDSGDCDGDSDGDGGDCGGEGGEGGEGGGEGGGGGE